jgi:hypothetical protein
LEKEDEIWLSVFTVNTVVSYVHPTRRFRIVPVNFQEVTPVGKEKTLSFLLYLIEDAPITNISRLKMNQQTTIVNKYREPFDIYIGRPSLFGNPYRIGPDENPHTHLTTQVMCFLGSDPDDLSELGAEFEICMGKEQERHVFTSPTAVVAPPFLPHWPGFYLGCRCRNYRRLSRSRRLQGWSRNGFCWLGLRLGCHLRTASNHRYHHPGSHHRQKILFQ